MEGINVFNRLGNPSRSMFTPSVSTFVHSAPAGFARARRRAWEAPTMALTAAIYAGWFALTWFHGVLPWWLVLPLGAWLVAWHGSLQHEIIHGHPTRDPRVNMLLGSWPLALWLPYCVYRDTHLAHHRSELTDPYDDPESWYVAPERWATLGPAQRGMAWALQTLAGRLVLGPWVQTLCVWTDVVRDCLRGDRRRLLGILIHGVLVGAL